MQPRVTLVTLGVEDLARAYDFYHRGLGWPSAGIVGAEGEDGGVAFFELAGGLRLALWGRASLAADAGVTLAAGGAPGISLAHNVASPAAVDAVLAQAVAAGATLRKPGANTFWGGYSGYFQDPDGVLWEVAWNPAWDLPAG